MVKALENMNFEINWKLGFRIWKFPTRLADRLTGRRTYGTKN